MPPRPEEDLDKETASTLKRWKLVNKDNQRFWHRWTRNYICTYFDSANKMEPLVKKKKKPKSRYLDDFFPPICDTLTLLCRSCRKVDDVVLVQGIVS